jgi:hypothetical protein
MLSNKGLKLLFGQESEELMKDCGRVRVHQKGGKCCLNNCTLPPFCCVFTQLKVLWTLLDVNIKASKNHL